MSITAPMDFKGMTPDQIAAEITRRRQELTQIQAGAKAAGIKLPRASKDEGPKTLVPVLSAAVRRTAAAHRRTRLAQQEEAAIKELENQAVAKYLADNALKDVPKEVRAELAEIRRSIGDVELPDWVDPMIEKKAKEAAKKLKAAQAKATEGEVIPQPEATIPPADAEVAAS